MSRRFSFCLSRTSSTRVGGSVDLIWLRQYTMNGAHGRRGLASLARRKLGQTQTAGCGWHLSAWSVSLRLFCTFLRDSDTLLNGLAAEEYTSYVEDGRVVSEWKAEGSRDAHQTSDHLRDVEGGVRRRKLWSRTGFEVRWNLELETIHSFSNQDKCGLYLQLCGACTVVSLSLLFNHRNDVGIFV